MSFIEALKTSLKPYHLLSHRFYEAWNAGTLSLDSLKYYACQYYHHEKAFIEDYLPSIVCEDNDAARKVITANYEDEVGGNHLQLWCDFGEALGATRDEITNTPANKETAELVETLSKLCKSSLPEAIGALYAYEYQIPEVAKSKIAGLIKHEKNYGKFDERGTKFFAVHTEADEWHAQGWENILKNFSPEDQLKAKNAAIASGKALWKFLDGIPCECEMVQ
jgi:pyrroloquinoline-quinone synthase